MKIVKHLPDDAENSQETEPFAADVIIKSIPIMLVVWAIILYLILK